MHSLPPNRFFKHIVKSSLSDDIVYGIGDLATAVAAAVTAVIDGVLLLASAVVIIVQQKNDDDEQQPAAVVTAKQVAQTHGS